MSHREDKWFSMRTDFFGREAHHLNVYRLSADALATYVSSIAYACRWGIDYAFKTQAVQAGARPIVATRELVEHDFWYPLPDQTYGVQHEGTLWRRGDPRQRPAIPLKIRAAVMERDNFACVECGATQSLSMDHIWPYSKGGGDTVENLRVLCRSCNSRKGARI